MRKKKVWGTAGVLSPALCFHNFYDTAPLWVCCVKVSKLLGKTDSSPSPLTRMTESGVASLGLSSLCWSRENGKEKTQRCLMPPAVGILSKNGKNLAHSAHRALHNTRQQWQSSMHSAAYTCGFGGDHCTAVLIVLALALLFQEIRLGKIYLIILSLLQTRAARKPMEGRENEQD